MQSHSLQTTGNEYGLTDDTRSTWKNAQATAQSLGGNLVTINDAAEQQWLVDQFQTESDNLLWIGLNDEAQEGVYEWASGETASYRNFAPRQPDNFGGNEDYFLMGWTELPGKWNDLPNNAINNRFLSAGIVERSATPVPTPAPLLGLIGLGISTIRKQRKQSTAE